ncbi:MAG: DUF4012 domain-containing protein, partial [Anaerolineae bacterium]
HLSALEALAPGGETELGFDQMQAAGQHLAGMHQDLEAVESLVGPLLPLGRLLAWLPGYGGDLAAAPDLLAVANGVAAAGDGAFQALAPALPLLAGEGESQGGLLGTAEGLLPVLVDARPALQEAQAELAAVDAARRRIDSGALSPRVASLVERLDRYLPWLYTAVDGGLLAPDLLGAEGPRTFLIVAQNNQELRPTGGFISGVGELHVGGEGAAGRIAPPSFSDSYAVDNLAVPHEDAPQAMKQVLLGDMILFRDANWDPDFPTSARRALAIYARDQGVEANGVVALDLNALQMLVAAVGPLAVEGVDTPVTGQNIQQVIQASWNEGGVDSGREWWLHRKDFMGEITKALVARFSEGREVHLLDPAQALKQALDEKHLLLYIHEPEAAALLRARNWDGALPAPAAGQDWLMVVDTNVGFNKVDANVDRSLHYRVDLSDPAAPRATLAVTYQHRSRRPVGDCLQEADYGDAYEDMMDRCYWDYVRAYVPAASRLLEGPEPALPPGSLLARSGRDLASPPVSPTLQEGAWSVWAAFFSLPTMDERTLTWAYALPAGTVSAASDEGLLTYRLQVQKQPGTVAVPLRLEIVLPPGAELVEAVPALEVAEAGHLLLDTDLRRDREFVLTFAP